MAQRQAIHRHAAIAIHYRLLTAIDAVEDDAERHATAEIVQPRAQHLLQVGVAVDVQVGRASCQRERGNQPRQAEDVVAVQMGYEDGGETRQGDALTQQLLLYAFAAVHEKLLAVDDDELRRRIVTHRRGGAAAAENVDCELFQRGK